jgi:SMODS and SLOG-associating 2TM effector domain 2
MAASPGDGAIGEAGPDTAPVRGAASRTPGGGRRRDLTARPFPVLDSEQWQQPEMVLRELYLDAESRAIETYDWYLRDRVGKKHASRIFRGLALALGSAGGLVPLTGVASGHGASGWGYVLLALAGVCVGFDHFLGLSSRWMRDMMTAQKIQRRLAGFQLDWAALNAADAVAPAGTSIDVPAYLHLLREFTTDLSSIMIDETAEWVTEFQSGIHQLQSQTGRR